MNAERRKQAVQVVVLLVLLVGLGFSMWNMLHMVRGNAPAHPSEPSTSTPSTGDKLGAVTPTRPESTTGTTAAQAQGGQASEQNFEIPEKIEMNPNLFRVYQLSPAKNPFKQEESWYKEELEQVPGYPELRDSHFLESMSPVVPDMSELLGEDESWQEVELTKTKKDKVYQISGQSSDESIDTALTYKGPPGQSVEINWHPGSGVPLSALSDPSTAQNFAMQGGVPAAMPSDEDLFQQPGEGGELKIPGVDELITGGVVSGDQIYCHGISVKDGRAYALVSFNGTTRLVQEGDSLPPRYTVQAITGDGAVLFNLRTEETQWLPVRAPAPQDAAGGSTGATATGSTYTPQPMFPVVGGR
jgi:hypothetical protein